jgi:predicted RNA-binding protein with PUA-like domain
MWLLKSEPNDYSFDDLMNDNTTIWDGVKNYQAINNMKEMKKGEKVLFYHTGNQRRIVGLCEVTKEAYEYGEYTVVEIKAIKKFSKTVTLKEVKADEFFKDWALVRQGRLSVVPVEKKYWEKINNILEG